LNSIIQPGLIHGIECGHHLRKGEESEFREGLVLDRPTKPTQGSFVSVGLVNVKSFIKSQN